MSRTDKALDAVFVVACVAAVGFIALKTLSSRTTPAATLASYGFQIQERIDVSVPGDYATRARTFLVVVNSACKYCTASMPFYAALRERAARCPDVGLRFVSREPASTTGAYLAGHGLHNADVLSVPIQGLKGTRYPTILLVNQASEVVEKWEGVVPPDRETRVLALATCSAARAGA